MRLLSVLVVAATLSSVTGGEAATIVFDHCTFASECGSEAGHGVVMNVTAFGTSGDTSVRVFAWHPIWLINDAMLFGFAAKPGMAFTGPSAVAVTGNAISHPTFGEFPFSVDILGPLGNDPLINGFSFSIVPVDGHLELNPFVPNDAGFMAMAHVRNVLTGEEGFVATGPFNGQQADLIPAITPIPEPASVILFATGLAALGRTLRRRSR